MTFTFQFLPRIGHVPSLDLLVGIFNHHHGSVDHSADGDGNPAKGHDVGVDTLIAHHDEGDQHPNRQGNDCHQR